MKSLRILLLITCSALLPSCLATAIVGGTTAVSSAVGDQRSLGSQLDDASIATSIDARLMAEKEMPSRWVSVEVIEGDVLLTGYLPSQEHIDRAVYIAKKVSGVRSVKSNLLIGSPSVGSVVTDTWITARVKAKLLDDPIVHGFSVHVETVDGKVYLSGVVAADVHRFRAKELVMQVSGVTAVVDQLKVNTHQ